MTHRHGYFMGAGYTYGAYPEPSPERLALLAILRGHRPPELSSPFRVLELGCGQGFHLCLQAANYPQAQFLGIDLNPEHIAHARSLAASAQLTNLSFRTADFLELEQNPDALGEPFDLVVAHGILGWVSPAVGSVLLRLSSIALRPGGMLYLSYNTFPGWLSALPFQHAIRTFQDKGKEGLAAIESARQLFADLKQSNAQLFLQQPSLTLRLEALAGHDSAYLLHEYNHREWQPLFVNQVIDAAQQHGLSYLGSASLAENFDGLMPRPIADQLRAQSDQGLKELIRDLATGQSFRRDVFVNGRDPLWPGEARAALDALRLMSLADAEALARDDAFTFQTSFGQIQGNRDWFLGLLQDFGDQPVPLETLRADQPATPLPELLQNLVLLISRNLLVLVPPERDSQPAQRFNAMVASRVSQGAPYRAVACPVSGNLLPLSDLEAMAMHALFEGCPEWELEQALESALQVLERQPLRDGMPLGESELQAELQQRAEAFRRSTLPVLRRLGAFA